jgi:hypothetical protein
MAKAKAWRNEKLSAWQSLAAGSWLIKAQLAKAK